MIQFLYQAINQKKKIYLLTRSIFPLAKLEDYKISPNIFNKIVYILHDQKKSSYIYEKDAIFIDDSFKEREDVFKEMNIPVFNLDMVESLLNTKY
jgi:hypothetical protein